MARMSKGAAMLRDAVYGAAIGDALGVPYEFKTRGTFECKGMASYGSHHQPAGTFSDDTAMMLATCDSIRELRRIDCADMLEKFRAWARHGKYSPDGVVFDIGNTTSCALSRGHGGTGERDNGNGSLMRIAPLAYTDATDDEIRAVSAITHAHSISTEACVAFVHLLRKIEAGTSFAEATATMQIGRHTFTPSRPVDEIRSGGFVLDTLYASLWCLANTYSFADCVLLAVNLGSDTDTTGCVAGALAGAVYGIEDIPAEWMETLRAKDVIEACLF